MLSGILDLPTELLLQILRHLKPQNLFRSPRLVNKHFQACVEDIFRYEHLPTFEIQLDLMRLEFTNTAGSVYQGPSHPTVHLISSLRSVGEDGAAHFELAEEGKHHSEDPDAQWRYATWETRMTASTGLPPWYQVTLGGKEFRKFILRRNGVLEDGFALDWKLLMAFYLSRVSEFDDIKSMFSVRSIRAEAVYRPICRPY